MLPSGHQPLPGEGAAAFLSAAAAAAAVAASAWKLRAHRAGAPEGVWVGVSCHVASGRALSSRRKFHHFGSKAFPAAMSVCWEMRRTSAYLHLQQKPMPALLR